MLSTKGAKEGAGERGTLSSEETPPRTGDLAISVPNPSLEEPSVEVLDTSGINFNTNIASHSPGSSPNLSISAYTASGIKGSSTLEELMGQILVEFRALKLLQKETRRETKDQLSQLNTHLTHLSSRVSKMEQRVSNLEDVEHRTKSTTSRIQSELEDLQLKLDEAENRSRRSNLRFVGIPEGTEAASSVTNVISELIYKVILPDKDRAGGDFSIMRAHRVPFTRPVNSKYPRTILVNFGDFRIKEQILSQARAIREFKSDGKFTFRVFADMSVAAAHLRLEFVGLIEVGGAGRYHPTC
ncbi:hypothetical protein NDU88_008071 [Pleurodeles waltl]|uniref:L1 transposable element RRM domain-containing protein n=1 Tax=Pleurodeles waltl TaxID=8319 RepID=A0AAV7QNN5_PLEWA|nr:hypothetical protein NDU88_008071 [Pleurodeles waltl]